MKMVSILEKEPPKKDKWCEIYKCLKFRKKYENKWWNKVLKIKEMMEVKVELTPLICFKNNSIQWHTIKWFQKLHKQNFKVNA